MFFSYQILMNVPEINQNVVIKPFVWTQMVATCVPVVLVSLDLDSSVLVCMYVCMHAYKPVKLVCG